MQRNPPTHPSDSVRRSSTNNAERPIPNLQQRLEAGVVKVANVQKYASAAAAQCAIGMDGLDSFVSVAPTALNCLLDMCC